jgi:hypothetical protein
MLAITAPNPSSHSCILPLASSKHTKTTILCWKIGADINGMDLADARHKADHLLREHGYRLHLSQPQSKSLQART